MNVKATRFDMNCQRLFDSSVEIYRAREMRQLKSDFDKAVAGYLYGDEPPKKEK